MAEVTKPPRKAASVETESTVDDAPIAGEVDVTALIKQLQEQAAQQAEYIKQLQAQQGIPSDPVAAQVQALQQHVGAQANANPWHSAAYEELKAYVDKLDSEGLTDKQASKALRLVDKLQKQHPGHELAYARLLADDLYTMMLDTEED